MSAVDGSHTAVSPPGQPESTARGTVLLSAGQAAMGVSNGMVHIVAARVLLTEAYGRFAIAFVVLAWLSAIVLSIILPGLRKVIPSGGVSTTDSFNSSALVSS